VKQKLIAMIVLLSVVSARGYAEAPRSGLEKFFAANMPAAAWPAKAEADFAAFIGDVSTAAFIHKSSFSAPGVPSAVIVSLGEGTVCKYPVDKLRVVDYAGGLWRDVFQIERASASILRVTNSSGTANFRYDRDACIDLAAVTSRGVPGFFVLEVLSAGGVVTDRMPWFYSERGDTYVGTESMVYATENNIEGWFAYYFPDNSGKWPGKAVKTLDELAGEYKPDFIWKGDLLGTGNPAVFMLVYKGAPEPENKPDYMKGLSFYRLKILEYRKKWGGWKERVRADNGIYIDGADSVNSNVGDTDVYYNLMVKSDDWGKSFGFCGTVAMGIADMDYLAPCAIYSKRYDIFDATDFTKPAGSSD